jgi:protein arginine kinase
VKWGEFMSIGELISNRPSLWMTGTGPESDVVLSGRVRLARNLRDFQFPNKLTKAAALDVVKSVGGAIAKSDLLSGQFEEFRLTDLTTLDKQALVEKHLISPTLAEHENAAVFIKKDESVSIMVNEEDHLRLQVILPGFQVTQAWKKASQVDDSLEAKLNYAFDQERGYLTACPTNVGTGIRASVMVHLPALAMTKSLSKIIATIGQVGVVVRGLYGEGSASIGNIFQISNQITLGQSEDEILDNLNGVCGQIIEQERSARHKLLKQYHDKLVDKIGRAYGILTNAYLMTSQEAVDLLSDVRLGIDLGLISGLKPEVLNEMMVFTRPAYIQKLYGSESDSRQRDIQRAAMLRQRLKVSKDGGAKNVW